MDLLERIAALERRVTTLESLVRTRSKDSCPRIIAQVAEYFQIDPAEILGARRADFIVWPRHVSMYLCYKLTPRSCISIGRAFNRDHGTVLHAMKCVRNSIDTDPARAHQVAELKRRITDLLPAGALRS